MKIETQVTLKDNMRAAFFFMYTRPLTILLLILCVLFFVFLLAVHSTQGITMDGPEFFFLLFFILYLFLMPLAVYIQTKRQYKSNKNLHQIITYEFTNTAIELTGNKISSTLFWENIYQVRESKNLFYIYQNRGIANILPKRYFSREEIVQFREMVKRIGVKSKMKK